MSDKGLIVPLKVVPQGDASDRDVLLAKFDEYTKDMREYLATGERAGFALLAYSRFSDRGDNHISTMCNAHVHDPADCFWLPDAAKTRVYNRLHDED